MLRVSGSNIPTRKLRVVERQSISRSASIAVVRVGSSAYLVGATDSAVSLLADVSETIAAQEAEQLETETDSAHQGTGATAGMQSLHPARMDLVGAILQRMGRRG
jgi:flagellar biogenesis protein FliO